MKEKSMTREWSHREARVGERKSAAQERNRLLGRVFTREVQDLLKFGEDKSIRDGIVVDRTVLQEALDENERWNKERYDMLLKKFRKARTLAERNFLNEVEEQLGLQWRCEAWDDLDSSRW